jgi:hypothetical protein
MKFEIELPRAGLPIDREVTGVRWVKPKSGDYWLTEAGTWELTGHNWTGAHKLIADLAPVEVWRPATVEDAIRALRGEMVECRVWDGLSNHKANAVLVSYAPGCPYPWSAFVDHDIRFYDRCEVLVTCK